MLFAVLCMPQFFWKSPRIIFYIDILFEETWQKVHIMGGLCYCMHFWHMFLQPIIIRSSFANTPDVKLFRIVEWPPIFFFMICYLISFHCSVYDCYLSLCSRTWIAFRRTDVTVIDINTLKWANYVVEKSTKWRTIIFPFGKN